MRSGQIAIPVLLACVRIDDRMDLIPTTADPRGGWFSLSFGSKGSFSNNLSRASLNHIADESIGHAYRPDDLILRIAANFSTVYIPNVQRVPWCLNHPDAIRDLSI